MPQEAFGHWDGRNCPRQCLTGVGSRQKNTCGILCLQGGVVQDPAVPTLGGSPLLPDLLTCFETFFRSPIPVQKGHLPRRLLYLLGSQPGTRFSQSTPGSSSLPSASASPHSPPETSPFHPSLRPPPALFSPLSMYADTFWLLMARFCHENASSTWAGSCLVHCGAPDLGWGGLFYLCNPVRVWSSTSSSQTDTFKLKKSNHWNTFFK